MLKKVSCGAGSEDEQSLSVERTDLEIACPAVVNPDPFNSERRLKLAKKKVRKRVGLVVSSTFEKVYLLIEEEKHKGRGGKNSDQLARGLTSLVSGLRR